LLHAILIIDSNQNEMTSTCEFHVEIMKMVSLVVRPTHLLPAI
jgi:hypothetical protein